MRFDRLIAASLGLCALGGMLNGCTNLPGTTTTAAQGPQLHSERYGKRPGQYVRTLVVIVNGDGPPHLRNDDPALAKRLASAIPNSSIYTLLRPGYADRAGNISPGEKGVENGAHLDQTRLRALAGSIAAIEKRFPTAHHIVMGSSGGAALVADLAGLYPQLADGIVLAGCPCSMPEWRRYRAKLNPDGGWGDKVQALDPLRTAGGVDPMLRALIVVGENDKLAPPRFSSTYARAIALRGITTDFRILPGKGPHVLDDPEVIAATVRLAAQLESAK